MFGILFTVTFFIGIVLLLRSVLKKQISAGLQYGIWLLVAVKLLVFPVPDVEGDFSVFGLVAQVRQEEISGEKISTEEFAAAQAGGMAQEETQSGQAADGNLWANSGQGAEESSIAGTDTGVTPEYVGVDGKAFHGVARWYQMTKLRLLHYVEMVLKVPVWLACLLATGSLLCAGWMIVYHVRLGRYLRKRRVVLQEVLVREAERNHRREERVVFQPEIAKRAAGYKADRGGGNERRELASRESGWSDGREEALRESGWSDGRELASRESRESGREEEKLRERGWFDRKSRIFRVYSVEGLPTPCLFGRGIYIPAGLAEDQELLPYILRHEMCHYFHGDTIWGVLRMICVCLYWYHPLVWLAAYLSRQDCELACDEAVVKPMAGQERTRYGELLLKLVPVKSSPADCFSMTTAMSGDAKNLGERLKRITGKGKNTVIPGVLTVAAVLVGIYACVTSGFVSVEKQWQSIRIREDEESIPIMQESYRLDYRLSKDAASYGLYLEQYEYGNLTEVKALDCAALIPEGEVSRKTKRGEALYTRELEADEATGSFVKSVSSYSMPDYTTSDRAGSAFKAFTLDLSEGLAIGSSFSMAAGEELEHRFRLGEDIILLASYYGDGSLSVPPGHIFETEKYMEKTEGILESDSCVILVHLIVSDKSAEELRGEISEIVRKKAEESTMQAEADTAGGTSGEKAEISATDEDLEAETDSGGAEYYTNRELLKMAENFYRSEHGFAPAHMAIDSQNGNEVVIWLYDYDEFLNGENEIVGTAHTGDWYTVDRLTGKGENVLLEEIDLTQTASLTEPWSGKIEEMTVADVREEEKFSALPARPEAGPESRLYLLGETEHYRLYGAGDYQSMLLEEQGIVTEISVPFITDGITMMAPGVQEADYDGDGSPELAVKLLWGEGTGVWQEHLWMFDKKAGQIEACAYPGGAYAEELLRRLSFAETENGKIITLGGRQISPKLREGQGVSYEEMRINTSRVSFALTDGTIKLRTLISCGSRAGSVMPAYGDGCLEAEVLYDGSQFFIRDVTSADLKETERLAEEAVRAFYAPKGIDFFDYNVGDWRLSEKGEEMEMTLTLQERTEDSYDYATVPLVREETGQWAVAGEVRSEK